MIFPIGDEQVMGGHKPIISYTFIGLNLLVFLFQVSLPPGSQQGFVNTYGMVPAEITHGMDYYTLFTNMFLHGGWMHLFGNMMFLWVFADNIEAVVGKVRFILFYLGGGIFASLAHLAFNVNSMIPAIGASGAISAVLGAYMVMFPASRVKVWVLYLFRSFYIPAIYFLGFWAIQQFFNGFISIVPSSAFTSDIAWWAHIGGFVFGLTAGFIIRRQYESRALHRHKHSPKDFV
jgi:membrane associated rhomboid family serine protease